MFPLTVSVRPIVVEPMSDLLVDGRHGLHVALPPLASQVFGLHLEQLEDVQLHHGLLDLQRPLQDGSRFKHHQHLGGKKIMLRAQKNMSLINVMVICVLQGLTIVLECFHLVSLLRILSRLMQENRFLQQN